MVPQMMAGRVRGVGGACL